MSLKNRFSPSIKTSRTTTQIMNELTMALLVVWLFAVGYYFIKYGMNYALKIVLTTVVAMVTAFACEFIFTKLIKKDFKTFSQSSYAHVTVLILVLINNVNVGLFSIVIATIFAIVFGKLVYGGFGQNIFNPAAIGKVIIMTSFAGDVVADLATSVTPVSASSAAGWTYASGGLAHFWEQFGGMSGKALGLHAGAIGETSFVLLLILGVILVIRKVIDWRIPVFYVGSIAVFTTIMALVKGLDLTYPLFHVLTGGVMFAAVFMLTDPVTSPLHPIGRVLYAILAAFITLVIRIMGNTPDGVVFSILILNLLVPMIDYVMAGNLIKKYKRNMVILGCVSLICAILSGLVGTTLVAKGPEDENVKLISTEKNGEYTEYTIETKGFNPKEMNKIKVILDSKGAVSKVETLSIVDTPEIGGQVEGKDYLKRFEGITSVDSIDLLSGATITSTSVNRAVELALNTFGGQ